MNLDNLNLEDPAVQQFLQSQGFIKKDLRNDYTGRISLKDNVVRNLNWGFKTLTLLHMIMLANKIEKLDPIKEISHFAILLYVMCLEDMLNEKNEPTEAFLSFEDFVKMLPLDLDQLQDVAGAMGHVMAKQKEQLNVINLV